MEIKTKYFWDKLSCSLATCEIPYEEG